jgi:hypothetical protein
MTMYVDGGAPSVLPAGAVEFHAGPPGGESTRHLCAAAHLDRDFRDRAIEELVENRHRIAAPTPGTQAARVLAECLRARREALTGGLAVLVVLLFGLILALPEALFVVGLLLSARIAGAVARVATSLWALRVGVDPSGRVTERARRVLTVVFTGLLWAPGLILLAVDSTEQQSYNSLYPMDDQPSGDVSTGLSLGGPVLILVCLVAVGAVRRYRRHARLARLGAPGDDRSPASAPPGLAPVFARLQARHSEAETVYGEFSPFVGSGVLFDHWSYHSELRPSAQRRDAGRDADPLTVPGLHARINAAVSHLALGSDYPGDLLHQVTVRDRVFRSGLRNERPEVWYGGLSTVDPATGRLVLRPDLARALDEAAHERIRHYLEARVELWQGQVVASVFLRVHLQGQVLRIEGVPSVLPPVAEEYRVVDEILPPEPLSDGFMSVLRAIGNLGGDLVSAFADVWCPIRSGFRTQARDHWYQRMLRAGRMVDHAPRASLRELGAGTGYQQLFQTLDVERFFTAVQERALSAVLIELKLAGYDTSAFEQVVQNVSVNNGIQNVNSTVQGPQAAGRGASARTTGGGGGVSAPAARLGAG